MGASGTSDGNRVAYRLKTDGVGGMYLYRVWEPAWLRPVAEGEEPSPRPPSRRKGERLRTERLSQNAARTIRVAAQKAKQDGLGFEAFWTFTFSPRVELPDGLVLDSRTAVAEGLIVPSAEVRRFLNSFSQTFRNQYPSGDYRRGQFAYVWVAENPLSETGENPHIHLLTNFTVPRDEFDEFAAATERRWRLGTVHLELLRKPAAAAAYMMKAVGYVSKGREADRAPEPVWGRRWGCSANVRPERRIQELTLPAGAAENLRKHNLDASSLLGGPKSVGGKLVFLRHGVAGHGYKSPDAFLQAATGFAAELPLSQAAQAEEDFLAAREGREAEAAASGVGSKPSKPPTWLVYADELGLFDDGA